jgi:hypothetical protein
MSPGESQGFFRAIGNAKCKMYNAKRKIGCDEAGIMHFAFFILH